MLSNVPFITIKDIDPGMCTQCGDVVRPFSILCVSNECGLEEVNHMFRRYFMRACDK